MRVAAASLAALTLLRLAIAAYLPLVPDEAYYWVWSRALAPGYLDHPPMVALWIAAGTAIFGDNSLGVRLLGPLAAALETVMLADAAARLFPGRKCAVAVGVLWNAMPLVGAGSLVMTPDAPLLLFWCGTLWAMARIATGAAGGWWLVAGAGAGLALVSKYTAAFLWLGIALWLVFTPPGRKWLRRPAPWLGALLGGLLFLPVILWNADHGWASFLKQGGRVADWQPTRALTFLGELFGGQMGMVSPGIGVLCAAGLAAMARRGAQPARAILLLFSVPAALVFTQHAFGDRVQGNWPAVIYPAAVIAAGGLVSGRWWRWLRPSVATGFALTAVVLFQALTFALPVPSQRDPLARQLLGWAELETQLDELGKREGVRFVIAEDYALSSELAWHAPALQAVAGVDQRLDYTTLDQVDLSGAAVLLVRTEHRGAEIDPARWGQAKPLGIISRQGPHGAIDHYRVWRAEGRGTAAALPRRRVAQQQ